MSITVFAQESFYDDIKLGKYSVGFYDSLIFCEKEQYSQYEYEGSTPLFLQIWHPIAQTTHEKRLKINDFRKRNLSNDLASVYKPLCQKMDSAFVYYYIYNIQEDSINNTTHSYFDILDTLQNYKTQSYYNNIHVNSNLPVIIYHHGSQGNSDENVVLAEYFASRGYIVVSSNYHLPYENDNYGHSEGSENEAINLTKKVIEFARSLTTIDEVYFIGHSWGAQVGFSLLHERGWANAFVSMETTLEDKSTKDIKLEWPSLDSLMHIHEKNFSLPILMLTGKIDALPWEEEEMINLPFEFFRNITNAPTIHATTKEVFWHNSYISASFLKYLFRDQFVQSPSNTLSLKKQLELYKEHLKLIEDFIKSCRDNYLFDKTKYKDNFSIEKYNANKD